jgi:hypothetical protein
MRRLLQSTKMRRSTKDGVALSGVGGRQCFDLVVSSRQPPPESTQTRRARRLNCSARSDGMKVRRLVTMCLAEQKLDDEYLQVLTGGSD